MVPVGNRPILWHIMMNSYACGLSDFAIALCSKGELIKQWLVELVQLYGGLQISITLRAS